MFNVTFERVITECVSIGNHDKTKLRFMCNLDICFSTA